MTVTILTAKCISTLCVVPLRVMVNCVIAENPTVPLKKIKS